MQKISVYSPLTLCFIGFFSTISTIFPKLKPQSCKPIHRRHWSLHIFDTDSWVRTHLDVYFDSCSMSSIVCEGVMQQNPGAQDHIWSVFRKFCHSKQRVSCLTQNVTPPSHCRWNNGGGERQRGDGQNCLLMWTLLT